MRVSKLPLTAVSSSSYLVNTVVDTLYSSLLSKLDVLASAFYDLMSSLSVPSDAVDYVILALSAFDLLVCLVGGIVFIKMISKYQGKVMHIFLEIPRKYALYLNGECETYVAELQVLPLLIMLERRKGQRGRRALRRQRKKCRWLPGCLLPR